MEHDVNGAIEPESSVQGKILFALGSLPELRLWRQNAGLLQVTSARECPHCRWVIPRRAVRGAPDGAADLSGICHGGRRLEIEVKTSVGKQRDSQKRWEEMIRQRGGVYLLARSTDDALNQLRKLAIIL